MLYPFTIEVHRTRTVAGAGTSNATLGLTGYSGAVPTAPSGSAQGEDVLYRGIPANVQAAATGRKRDSALPQDVVTNPTWDIYIPASALPYGAIRDRDIIVDDQGWRYEVGQNYWNILGYKLMCVRLEA